MTKLMLILTFSVGLTSCFAKRSNSTVKTPGVNSASSKDWDPASLTNPKNYHQKSRENGTFSFIVLAVSDEKLEETRHAKGEQIARANNQIIEVKKYIDLIKTPEKIADKPVISASLINQDYAQTWGDCGYILFVPPQNIVATSPSDMGITPIMLPGTPLKQVKIGLGQAQKKYGILPPSVLISKSISNRYNEIAIVGRTDAGSEVKIQGVFLKVDQKTGKEFVSTERANALYSIAQRNKWPVVKIWLRGYETNKSPP